MLGILKCTIRWRCNNLYCRLGEIFLIFSLILNSNEIQSETMLSDLLLLVLAYVNKIQIEIRNLYLS